MTTVTAPAVRTPHDRHARQPRRFAVVPLVGAVLVVAVVVAAAWLIWAQHATITRQSAAQRATAAQLAATQQDLRVKLNNMRQLTQQQQDLRGQVNTWKQLSRDQFACSMGLVSALQAAENEDWQQVSSLLNGQAAGCSDVFGRYGDLVGEQSQSPAPAVPTPTA